MKTDKVTFQDTTDPEKPVDKAIYEAKNFFGVNYESVNREEFVKLLPEEAKEKLEESLKSTSQSSLKVAAVLPLIMAISFLMIIIYYKSIGGYKPVILADEMKDKK